MARRRPSARGERRARARGHATLVRDLDRLARLQPGGAPEHPLTIASPAQVEPLAQTTPCPLCAGTLRLVEHTAETIGSERLRVARVACTQCGTDRAVYFRLAERWH